jgi:hypothetical protein
MEQSDFKEKTDSMLPDLMARIQAECKRLFELEAVDPEPFDNDFELPKIIMTVALENVTSDAHKVIYPIDEVGRKHVAILKYL